MHAAMGDVRSHYYALIQLAFNWRVDNAAARAAFDIAAARRPRVAGTAADLWRVDGRRVADERRKWLKPVAYRRAVRLH